MADKTDKTDKKSIAARAKSAEPGLYVAATPIGNAGDVTLRALAMFEAADLVLCEDTRVTAKLFAIHNIRAPLDAYHEHNAAAKRPGLIQKLQAGATLVLVSDAGTPLISDPGLKLVQEALAAGVNVTALPGASSVLAALTVSGLPTDRFLFEGFLPPKKTARCAILTELAAVPATLVFLESPRRVAAVLADMAALFGPRDAAVARELTKKFEEVRRGPLDGLAAHYEAAGAPKGELVILVAPPAKGTHVSAEELDALLTKALSHQSLKDAVAGIMAATGLPRRHIYSRALELVDAGKTGKE